MKDAANMFEIYLKNLLQPSKNIFAYDLHLQDVMSLFLIPIVLYVVKMILAKQN